MTLETGLESQILPPIYKVTQITESPVSRVEYLPAPYGSINSKVMLADLTANERITTEDHFQDTRKVTFKLPSGHPAF